MIPDTMRELYTIIISDDRYIPNLVEEYVLAHAIDEMVEAIKGMDGALLTDPIPERDRVYDALVEYYMEEMEETKEEAQESARDRIRGLEDFSDIIEYCFWDIDYEMLEVATPEAMRVSGVDAELGIGTLEPAMKRLPNGDLEPINPSQDQAYITVNIKE